MEKRLGEMVRALRAAGHRVTRQRLAILRALAGGLDHPDVERIHREVRRHHPILSLATVYKTVAQLKAVGQVMELEFSGLGNRYDGNRPWPHPHVLCESCGRIVDSEALDMQRTAAAMCQETGYLIRSSRVDFFGTCPDCQTKET